MNYTLFDGLALGDTLADAANPKPFRLFAVGDNHLTRNGNPFVLKLSAEDIRKIAGYQHSKGEKIPIDSRHALFLAAEKAGLSELDAARSVPGGVAALGYAALEAREDGLYAKDVELLPLAEELFRNGCLRYFSPVIRGLDGKSPLRITSIAMDNVPALNNLDVLAASDTIMPGGSGEKRKGSSMNKTEAALAELLGVETLALSGETDAEVAAKLAALGAELSGLREAKEKLIQMELSAETAEKEALINKAIAENRATNAEREGLMQLSVAWLSAELPKRPAAAVPVAAVPQGKEEDEDALTDAEKAFAAERGIPEDEFIKSKKGVCK